MIPYLFARWKYEDQKVKEVAQIFILHASQFINLQTKLLRVRATRKQGLFVWQPYLGLQASSQNYNIAITSNYLIFQKLGYGGKLKKKEEDKIQKLFLNPQLWIYVRYYNFFFLSKISNLLPKYKLCHWNILVFLVLVSYLIFHL